MRISAIYIEYHDYLFDAPQTINFGTKYFYSFEKENDNINISRTINKNFIPNFFDSTNLGSKLTNINAIVGQNGAGKSTLLDIIRSVFINNQSALPYAKSLFLIESNDSGKIFILKNDFGKAILKGHDNKEIELKENSNSKIKSIYYSPHYDYKYNPNFDNIDNHDISFDKILENDLKELGEKDTNEGGRPYSVAQELVFKNSLRQIHFLSSDLVKKQNIFKYLFQLQNHYEPILYFRGYKGEVNEHNTPYHLRSILRSINDKAEKESSEWYLYRDKGASQVQINQYLLKRNVIKCILSVIYKQLEKTNSFLHEGDFPYKKLNTQLEKADSYKSLIMFAKYGAIKIKPKKTENIFKKNILEKLLEKIYSSIDKAKSQYDVSNESLKLSPEDAVEVLQLQRRFFNELNSYHVKFYSNKAELIIDESDKVEEFINYMPYSRRMSSGESALLNLYSRIYSFLDSNLKELTFRQVGNHYILLLDEADLTFHISWKKKYIKALIKTLPHFFNELKTKPSIEIIFTTHDPIALSDLPNTNVVYIERQDYDSPSNVLMYNDKNRPSRTFGANISDLIADSFFIESSLIGNFVFDKIHDTIQWLTNKEDKEKSEYYKKLISLIDEPIVQRKLAEMYDEKMETNIQVLLIEDQIQKLIDLKNKITK